MTGERPYRKKPDSTDSDDSDNEDERLIQALSTAFETNVRKQTRHKRLLVVPPKVIPDDEEYGKKQPILPGGHLAKWLWNKLLSTPGLGPRIELEIQRHISEEGETASLNSEERLQRLSNVAGASAQAIWESNEMVQMVNSLHQCLSKVGPKLSLPKTPRVLSVEPSVGTAEPSPVPTTRLSSAVSSIMPDPVHPEKCLRLVRQFVTSRHSADERADALYELLTAQPPYEALSCPAQCWPHLRSALKLALVDHSGAVAMLGLKFMAAFVVHPVNDSALTPEIIHEGLLHAMETLALPFLGTLRWPHWTSMHSALPCEESCLDPRDAVTARLLRLTHLILHSIRILPNSWVRNGPRLTSDLVDNWLDLLCVRAEESIPRLKTDVLIQTHRMVSPCQLVAVCDPQASWFLRWTSSRYGRSFVASSLARTPCFVSGLLATVSQVLEDPSNMSTEDLSEWMETTASDMGEECIPPYVLANVTFHHSLTIMTEIVVRADLRKVCFPCIVTPSALAWYPKDFLHALLDSVPLLSLLGVWNYIRFAVLDSITKICTTDLISSREQFLAYVWNLLREPQVDAEAKRLANTPQPVEEETEDEQEEKEDESLQENSAENELDIYMQRAADDLDPDSAENFLKLLEQSWNSSLTEEPVEIVEPQPEQSEPTPPPPKPKSPTPSMLSLLTIAESPEQIRSRVLYSTFVIMKALLQTDSGYAAANHRAREELADRSYNIAILVNRAKEIIGEEGDMPGLVRTRDTVYVDPVGIQEEKQSEDTEKTHKPEEKIKETREYFGEMVLWVTSQICSSAVACLLASTHNFVEFLIKLAVVTSVDSKTDNPNGKNEEKTEHILAPYVSQALGCFTSTPLGIQLLFLRGGLAASNVLEYLDRYHLVALCQRNEGASLAIGSGLLTRRIRELWQRLEFSDTAEDKPTGFVEVNRLIERLWEVCSSLPALQIALALGLSSADDEIESISVPMSIGDDPQQLLSLWHFLRFAILAPLDVPQAAQFEEPLDALICHFAGLKILLGMFRTLDARLLLDAVFGLRQLLPEIQGTMSAVGLSQATADESLYTPVQSRQSSAKHNRSFEQEETKRTFVTDATSLLRHELMVQMYYVGGPSELKSQELEPKDEAFTLFDAFPPPPGYWVEPPPPPEPPPVLVRLVYYWPDLEVEPAKSPQGSIDSTLIVLKENTVSERNFSVENAADTINNDVDVIVTDIDWNQRNGFDKGDQNFTADDEADVDVGTADPVQHQNLEDSYNSSNVLKDDVMDIRKSPEGQTNHIQNSEEEMNWIEKCVELVRKVLIEDQKPIRGTLLADLTEKLLDRLIPDDDEDDDSYTDVTFHPEERAGIALVCRYGSHLSLLPSLPEITSDLESVLSSCATNVVKRTRGQHFNWFAATVFLIFHGEVNQSIHCLRKCKKLMWKIWPEDADLLVPQLHIIQTLLEIEAPSVVAALQRGGFPASLLSETWLRQAMWDILDWEEIGHYFLLCLMGGAAVPPLVCVALLVHLGPVIIKHAASGTFRDYAQHMKGAGFRPAEWLPYVEKLAVDHRRLLIECFRASYSGDTSAVYTTLFGGPLLAAIVPDDVP